MFEAFTTDLNACSDITYSVVTSNSDSTPPITMGAPEEFTEGGDDYVKIAPVDILTVQSNPFWVLAVAKGGAQTFQGPLEFILRCASNTVTGVT